MPTISFDFNDFLKLLGRKISAEQFGELLLDYAKAELEHYDKKIGEVTIKLGDTNLPYLWSAEGIAILLKGVLGIEKGIPEIKVKKSEHKIIVDKSVSQIRPFIAAFVMKGKRVDDYLLKQLVQMQEKLSENYGRKREKVSIGLYKSKNLAWPLHYRAVDPESARFIPLEFSRPLNLRQILDQHPKGKQYAKILADAKRYPIFMDSNNDVLSFPPIINSNTTGRVMPGNDELLVEVTGTDERSVNLAANIFAQNMHLRGFELESVEISYGTRKVVTPELKTEHMKIKNEDVQNLLGLSIKESEVKYLLEKMRFGFHNFNVSIPHFRQDIMHPNDIVEDIGIMYGYNKISALPLKAYTTGGSRDTMKFVDKVREIFVGLGYQEILSAILSNKELLSEKTQMPDKDMVEIENYMSENYSVVRNWVTPVLLDVLSKNAHVSYPQRLFEQGTVTKKMGDGGMDVESLSFVSAHNEATYTEMRQAIDYLLVALGLSYTIQEYDHPSFIPGRAAKMIVNGKEIAFLGEVHPKVLQNFNLSVPVAAAELNLSELFASSPKQ